MENMTKEELIAGILQMDNSYSRLNISLDKYSIEDLKIHYLRKKNAPQVTRSRWNMRPWQVTEVVAEPEIKKVTKTDDSLVGFASLDKDKLK